MSHLKSQYITIYEEVRQDIIAGVYPYGSKLPSKRVMCERKGVSVITVSHAYELLEEEGYITSRERSGYFVSFIEGETYGSNVADTTDVVVDPELEDIIAIDANSKPEDFSFNIYAKTARRVLSEYGDELFKRASGSGTVILREAIAGYLMRSRHMNVAYDQIIIGSGAEYLYGLIVQSLGRDVIYGIEDPSYEKIEQVYTGNGVKVEKLKLGSDGIESSRLWESKAKVLHISPYKSYPSLVTASASKKREYLKWSMEKDAIIIEDDYESEFTPSRKTQDTLFAQDTGDHVIYVNTFTRTIGSAVRTAYMVIPRSMKPLLRERIGFYSCPVPSLTQYIIAELINNGDFERHINRVRRKNRNKK